MHKTQFIDEIAKRTSGTSGPISSKSDVELVVNTALDVIERELRDGGEVVLIGFGTFKTSTRNPTNPQTQEKLGERKVPQFSAGKTLKETVKAGRPSW